MRLRMPPSMLLSARVTEAPTDAQCPARHGICKILRVGWRVVEGGLTDAGACRLVNMAYLATIGSKSTNGVAFIHSEIIKETIFKVVDLTLSPSGSALCDICLS